MAELPWEMCRLCSALQGRWVRRFDCPPNVYVSLFTFHPDNGSQNGVHTHPSAFTFHLARLVLQKCINNRSFWLGQGSIRASIFNNNPCSCACVLHHPWWIGKLAGIQVWKSALCSLVLLCSFKQEINFILFSVTALTESSRTQSRHSLRTRVRMTTHTL